MDMAKNSTRRDFLKAAGLAGMAITSLPNPVPQGESDRNPPAPKNSLPGWRGFNLQYVYDAVKGIKSPREEHFKWIADWGFDFVRLPMTYRAWLRKKVRPGDPPLTIDDVYDIDETTLEMIDSAVHYGDKYGIHVDLCFHHAPGYRTGITEKTGEPFLLWRDEAAVDALVFHWEIFAKRYQGVGASKISFNLLNEPPWYSDDFNGEVYANRIAPAVKAIRGISPERIIIADGAGAGNLCVPELAALGIHQSVHCYIPGNLSHYQVDWMKEQTHWPKPEWPGVVDNAGYAWGPERMAEFYTPWKRLIAQGIGVHMGETGGSHRCPHPVFLAWLTDVLEICKDTGIGFALWDFIGGSKFGILDTERKDVEYEDWFGHTLDRKMLTLLQKY